eukprot:TRINITY_DN85_c0_g2_i1.p1 TRINITY_DN85_c0_g2~~TRINITY_DN85_c0_g2_i1.p1  ORF type:complete len:335 (+),score=69.89 TRINITY_DN85_c0_g2_i1:696-1700(+)
MLRRIVTCTERSYCTDAVKARRERKKMLKQEELKRPRDFQSSSASVSAAVKLSSSGGKLSSTGMKNRVHRLWNLGLMDWAKVMWHGHRSRGGGLKSLLVSLVRVLSILSSTLFPMLYFFHDDGKATIVTRFAVCEQLHQVKDAKVLDIGTGNGELSKMISIEIADGNGTLTTIDKNAPVQKANAIRFRKQGYNNITALDMDVFDLKESEFVATSFTHTVISMCLHELDQNRRFSCLENTALKTQGGSIIVMDFTPSASGWSNLSQLRNTAMEWGTDHYVEFKDWVEKGGLPPVIEAMEEQRKSGKLKIPPLEIVKVEEEDRGTHAVYVIKVGTL